MARTTSAVKALEKALQQLKETEEPKQKPGRKSAKESKEETNKLSSLLKESRKFGDDLIAFYESEKDKVQQFLNTLSDIESGNYKPTRGGSRRGAPRKKRTTSESAS